MNRKYARHHAFARISWKLAAIGALLLPSPRSFAAVQPQFLYPSFGGKAYGVSHDGTTVVGTGNSTPFRWTLGGSTNFLSVGDALGVNADGSVVVGTRRTANSSPGRTEAFRWPAAGPTMDLGDFPGGYFYSLAQGVSGDGSIVVGSGNTDALWEAFRWTETTGMVGLGALPSSSPISWAYAISADGTTIVGQSSSFIGGQAYRWTESNGMEGLGLYPGAIQTIGRAVSEHGDVVVGWGQSAGGNEAFRWDETSGMVPLGDLPGGPSYLYSWASGVSGDGSRVVGFGHTDVGQEAFLWDADHGMRNLKEILVTDFGLDLTGWILNEATGISSDGTVIVGWGLGNGVTRPWVAIIPEPATVTLLGMVATMIVRKKCIGHRGMWS